MGSPPANHWHTVAENYEAIWSPRFRPFVQQALALFQPTVGPLGVPGCGPGDELVQLAQRLPGRRLIASDPAPAMVAAAQLRVSDAGLSDRVEVHQVAGSELPGQALLGGIFTSFVLQLLPDRAATLASWVDRLAPGGELALLFWPRQPEGSAWARLGAAAQETTGRERPEWEEPLRERLPGLGLTLLEERELVHEISYPSGRHAWDWLVEGCSLQSLLQRVGPEVLARCRDTWLEDPGLEERDGSFVHAPTARLWRVRPRSAR